MKTTILTVTVLMALGFTAHANDVPPAPPAPPETKLVSDQEKPVDAKKISSGETQAEIEAVREFKNFRNNKGQVGTLKVTVDKNKKSTTLKFTQGCTDEKGQATGRCIVETIMTDKITMDNLDDMAALRDALNEMAAQAEVAQEKAKPVIEEKLSTSERRKRDRTEEKSTKKEIREELDSMLSTECGIETDDAESRKERRESRVNLNLETAMARTRFSGLELPQKSPDSRSGDAYRSDSACSAAVLKEFMESHEADDLTDLKDKLSELKDDNSDLLEKQSDLRRDLRDASTPAEKEKVKALIEENKKAIEAKKDEMKLAQKDLEKSKKKSAAYDSVTTSIAKQLIINPAVTDLATRKFFTAEDFFLHDLATTTSDAFKGVRKAASGSLLDIYRKQAQSYLAFSEAATKTNDPTQKLQFQQAALLYQQAGMNYNNMMNNMRFKGELGHNAEQAGLSGKSILESIYGDYSVGAQEISSYLGTLNTNGTPRAGSNIAMPQILTVLNEDGSTSLVQVNGTTNVVGDARGTREGVGQPRTQLARPLPQAPVGNLTAISGGNTNGVNVQQPQPLINNGGQPQLLNNGVVGTNGEVINNGSRRTRR